MRRTLRFHQFVLLNDGIPLYVSSTKRQTTNSATDRDGLEKPSSLSGLHLCFCVFDKLAHHVLIKSEDAPKEASNDRHLVRTSKQANHAARTASKNDHDELHNH